MNHDFYLYTTDYFGEQKNQELRDALTEDLFEKAIDIGTDNEGGDFYIEMPDSVRDFFNERIPEGLLERRSKDNAIYKFDRVMGFGYDFPSNRLYCWLELCEWCPEGDFSQNCEECIEAKEIFGDERITSLVKSTIERFSSN